MIYRKTFEDLSGELREQRAALRSSSDSYDCGNRWESKRLASIAYILLHDGGRNSHSLLGQLGTKPLFLSTAREAEAPLPLATITISTTSGAWYQPNFDRFPDSDRWIKFGKWYEEKIFVSGNFSLSRKNIIHTFRNNMGGGHVDPVLKDGAFHWLSKVGPIRLGPMESSWPVDEAAVSSDIRHEMESWYKDADGPVPYGPEASMRQIAWEIEQSLERMALP